jgi:sporulation protein YlmC with PRC-barrel domain
VRTVDDDFARAPRPTGHLLDARLHLLDRQILDAQGGPIGIVDDLDVTGVVVGEAIARGTPPPRISGVLTGQVLATRIFGGTTPRAKLQPLPWRLVEKIGTVVQLRDTDQVIEGLWLEHWLRDHLIARIPWGQRATE